MFIFPVQLTTSRIGNLTRLIHTLLYVMTIHTYIHMHWTDGCIPRRGAFCLFSCTIFHQSCVCVCVFFPFILDIKFVGRTSRGHTGGRSHRISHPPSFCCACLNFSREKDSAIPFPRRPSSRILCTNDSIVLHPLSIFIFVFMVCQSCFVPGYVFTS